MTENAKKTETPLYSDDVKPCWRKNGIWGNETPRCEKLKFVEHCRNCDVFEDAAKDAINSDSTKVGVDGELLSFEELVQRQRSSGDLSILPIRLEQYCFAIPCNRIITIHDHIPIHSVPFNKNPVIKGVAAINHEIFTFVNIVELLSLPPSEKQDTSGREIGLYKRALVVDFNSRILAFYVDEVYQISRYYEPAVNEELPGSFLNVVSSGRLLAEEEWCGDCHILDVEKVSNEFERTFL